MTSLLADAKKIAQAAPPHGSALVSHVQEHTDAALGKAFSPRHSGSKDTRNLSDLSPLEGLLLIVLGYVQFARGGRRGVKIHVT